MPGGAGGEPVTFEEEGVCAPAEVPEVIGHGGTDDAATYDDDSGSGGMIGSGHESGRYRLADSGESPRHPAARPYRASMGAVTGSESVTINAPVSDVLAALRDLPSQVTWFPGCISSEVVVTNDDGLPARARQVNDVKVAKDEFDLDYTHTDTSMAWRLVAPSKAQKDASGSWSLTDRAGATEATLTLSIDPAIPLPGFLLKKALGDTLKGATKGLKKYCES